MDNRNIQWLLSLSTLSLLGPKYDIERLIGNGFYKKKSKDNLELMLNIPFTDDLYSKYKTNIQSFLDIMNITDKNSYVIKVNELITGSMFGNNMDKMMQLGKMMTFDLQEAKTNIVINKHPYQKALFNEVLFNEFNWPKEGLIAYDIANAVMLLRLGVELAYIIEEDQLIYLEQIYEKAHKYFSDYKKFGKDCNIGRNLHISHLKSIRSSLVIEDQTQLLSIAYFGIWQYVNIN